MFTSPFPASAPRIALFCLSFVVACAAAGGASPVPAGSNDSSPGAAQERRFAQAKAGELSRFAGEKVIVLPLQGIGAADPAGLRSAATKDGDRLLYELVDSLLEREFAARRGITPWVFPPALSRSAKRNPGYVTDPYVVRAAEPIDLWLRGRKTTPLSEPFASQVRSLSVIGDSRYALVPLEVVFEAAPGGGVAVLRLALVDTRAAQVTWHAEVRGGTPGTSEATAALIQDIARRTADLVSSR